MKRYTIDIDGGLEEEYLEAIKWGRIAPWFRARVSERLGLVRCAYGEARALLEPSAIIGEVSVALEGGEHMGLPATCVLVGECRETGLSATQLIGWLRSQEAGK